MYEDLRDTRLAGRLAQTTFALGATTAFGFFTFAVSTSLLSEKWLGAAALGSLGYGLTYSFVKAAKVSGKSCELLRLVDHDLTEAEELALLAQIPSKSYQRLLDQMRDPDARPIAIFKYSDEILVAVEELQRKHLDPIDVTIH